MNDILRIALVLATFLIPSLSQAAGKMYRINDCNGSPQQIGTVDSVITVISAKFPENEIPKNLKVILKNEDNVQVISQPLKDKIITFKDVPEGEWKLCIEPGKISLIDVEIE